MGRPKRITLGGYVYHVLNRANGRLRIFKKKEDFAAFEAILAEGMERVDMRICGYCIMGNHWHLLLWPRDDGDLSTFMRWVTQTHAQRWHAAHSTVGVGHVYRGRFKSFPVQNESYYLTAMQYIESNQVRAEIAKSPAEWPWSSAAIRNGRTAGFELAEGPIELPADWGKTLNKDIEETQLARIADSLKRGAPFGNPAWVAKTARKLGLESTIKPIGRPSKGT